MVKCWTCNRCVPDKEEPYLLVCTVGHLALSQKFNCEDYRMNNIIRVYVSHSIRGKKGNDATETDMKANNKLAIDFGLALRHEFPRVNFYVPGEHDEFVLIAYYKKYLSEYQILDVDCDIVQRCHFVLAFSPDGYLSRGMKVEIEYAGTNGIPVIVIPDLRDASKAILNRQILNFRS